MTNTAKTNKKYETDEIREALKMYFGENLRIWWSSSNSGFILAFALADGDFEVRSTGDIWKRHNGFTVQDHNTEKMSHELRIVLDNMLEDYKTGKSFAEWLES